MTCGPAAMSMARRKCRPPKVLIYLVCRYCMCLGWPADCALGVSAGAGLVHLPSRIRGRRAFDR
jgi:hypothetical protein